MAGKVAERNERSKLIEEHLPYARRLAAQFFRRRAFLGFEREDIESAAFLGLCEAAGRFDSSVGANFQSYSYTRINGSMFDLLRNEGELSKVAFSRTKGGNGENSKESTGLQLLKRIRQSARELVAYANAADAFSLSLVYCGESADIELVYRDAPSGEELLMQSDERRWLRGLVEKLPDPDRVILQLHYFQGLKFSDIAAHLPRFTKSKVCRYHQRAITNLRVLIEKTVRREALLSERLQVVESLERRPLQTPAMAVS